MKSITQIQEAYIDTVNAGRARWGHRPGIKGIADGVGGHMARIYRGARRAAEREFAKHNCWTPEQVNIMIQDAKDMAELQRKAEEE